MITYVHPDEPNQSADILASILDLLAISYEPYMPGFFIGNPSEENRVAYLLSRLLDGTLSPGSNGWSLDGNANTSSKSFGTTTNQDVVFITNDNRRGKITAAGKWIIGDGETAVAQLNVIGTGTDGLTIGLHVENNDGTKSFAIHDNGNIHRNEYMYSTSVLNNTSWGQNALSATGTGNYNVAIGHYALPTQETDYYVIGIGYYAGNNATGGEHVFIGQSAGIGTTGAGSVGIGSHACGSETSNGNFYVAIGYYSLTKNEGYGNVAVGGLSGYENSVGKHNVYIGNECAYSLSNPDLNNIFGDYNICIGDTALTGGNDFDSVISFNSKGGTGSNQIVFGGASNQYTGAQAYYTEMYLGNGVTHQDLRNFTIYGTSAVGEDIDMDSYELSIVVPRGTGAGQSGSFKIYHGIPGGSGTDLNATEAMLTIDTSNFVTIKGIVIPALAGHGNQPLRVNNNGEVYS